VRAAVAQDEDRPALGRATRRLRRREPCAQRMPRGVCSPLSLSPQQRRGALSWNLYLTLPRQKWSNVFKRLLPSELIRLGSNPKCEGTLVGSEPVVEY
jgi:hypothetical protein